MRVVKKEAYSKVMELVKKCEECKTQGLRDICNDHSKSMSTHIMNIYSNTESCNPDLVYSIYNLGREAGKLLLKAKEYERSEYDTVSYIISALPNIISTIRDEVAQILKEKCKCKIS